MKGILIKKFGGPDVLEYVDMPDQAPEPYQLLINVEGASVNYADVKGRSGEYHLGKQPPFIPGIDIAGRVLETGAAVKDIMPGDRVIAFTATGAYAEKALANRELTFKIPESLDTKTAAAFPLVAGAAMHMLSDTANLKDGETILIHGASGGVGSMAIQIAKSVGASLVVATSGSPWKEPYIRKCGADEVLLMKGQEMATDIQNLTDGRGFDVILNPIGGSTIDQDLDFLAHFGRLVCFGKMTDTTSNISPEVLYATNRTISGFSFGHYRKNKPQMIQETMNKVIRLIENNELHVPVENHFMLSEASLAHDLIEQQKVTGKVVLLPDAQ